MNSVYKIVWFLFFLVASCDLSEAQKRAQLNLQLGFELYMRDCSNCHQPDGSGLAKVIPPIKNSEWLLANTNRLPQLIKFGLKVPITVNGTLFTLPMPAYTNLSIAEITALSNFILFKFVNASDFFTENQVKDLVIEKQIENQPK